MTTFDRLERYGVIPAQMAASLEESAAQYDRWEAENRGAHAKGTFSTEAVRMRAEAAEWRAAQQEDGR